MKTVNDSYEELKIKLLQYYDEMKDLRKERNRLIFKNAQYKKGESLYLYSSRLEKLFRVAYPKHTVSTSKTLRDKFLSSVPKSHRSLIESQMMSYKVADKPLTWKVVQKISSLKDMENEKLMVGKSTIEDEEEKEIVINVGHESFPKNKDRMQPLHKGQNLKYTGRVYYSNNYIKNEPNKQRYDRSDRNGRYSMQTTNAVEHSSRSRWQKHNDNGSRFDRE